MDDLLERMLAVDLEGRQLVSQAEEQAVKIREENSAQVAEVNAQYSAKLSEECTALEQEQAALRSAEKQRETLRSCSEDLILLQNEQEKKKQMEQTLFLKRANL